MAGLEEDQTMASEQATNFISEIEAIILEDLTNAKELFTPEGQVFSAQQFISLNKFLNIFRDWA